MKKSITILLVSVMLIGSLSACKEKDNSSSYSQNATDSSSSQSASQISEPDSSEAPPESVDDGKHLNTIGLYLEDEQKTKFFLADTFNSKWVKGKDIGCFQSYYTREQTLPHQRLGTAFEVYCNNFEDAFDYKLGYKIVIKLNSGEELSVNILVPADTEKYKDYIETYLYDDYHATPGKFYSHLLTNQMKDDTIITGIKLTCGVKSDEVSAITLKAFAYKSADEFDESGNYSGKLYSTSLITRQQ